MRYKKTARGKNQITDLLRSMHELTDVAMPDSNATKSWGRIESPSGDVEYMLQSGAEPVTGPRTWGEKIAIVKGSRAIWRKN